MADFQNIQCVVLKNLIHLNSSVKTTEKIT